MCKKAKNLYVDKGGRARKGCARQINASCTWLLKMKLWFESAHIANVLVYLSFIYNAYKGWARCKSAKESYETGCN